MGVKGLIPTLKESIQNRHLSSFKGSVAGIDISAWLYRAMCGDKRIGLKMIIPFVEARMKMLQTYNIYPVAVFDGPTPPIKMETVKKRREKRSKMNIPSTDSNKMSQILKLLQTKLTKMQIPCIVSPYEADSQLAYLSNNGYVNLVITEDSDLIVLGCARVLLKLNYQGFGDYFDNERLSLCFDQEPHLFDFYRFRMMCLLMGCDYIDNIPGIGAVKARKIMKETTTYDIEEIINTLPVLLEKQFDIPKNYIEKYQVAQNGFQHPIVYDLKTRERKYLTKPPANLSKKCLAQTVGDLMEDKKELTLGLALGNVSIDEAASITGSFWSLSYIIPEAPAIEETNDSTADPYVRPLRVPSKCDQCGRMFSINYIEGHIRTHTGEKPFNCIICGKSFAEKSNLDRHLRLHFGEKQFKCNFSDASFVVCGISFAYKSNLDLHLKRHFDDKQFKCNVCDASFVSKYDCEKHIKIHSGEKPFTCDVCGISFSQNTGFLNHKKLHTGLKPYSCDVCGERFSQYGGLWSHKKTHTEESPFICTYQNCQSAFKRKKDLNRHLSTHTNEKPFSCDICGSRFKRKEYLQIHINKHKEEKPYTCNICGKSFKTTALLNMHKKVHTDQKPFACKICDKKFKLASYVRTHMKCKHKGNEKLSCHVCRMSFKNNCNLKKHMKHHDSEKPFKCYICKQQFSRRSTLKRHIRTHTGEKPYNCSICSRRFKQSGDLRRHKQIHRGLKPFGCNICGYRCSTSAVIKLHMQKHHIITHTGDKPHE